jgi:AraC-like DNA-binding protein
MRSQLSSDPSTDPFIHWRSQRLPIGLSTAALKVTSDLPPFLDIATPYFEGKGFAVTFLQFKGALDISPGGRSGSTEDRFEPAHPGMALMSVAGQTLRLRSSAAIQFSALTLFIPAEWVDIFLRGNAHFSAMESVLEEDRNIITCRLGRKQMSLFSSVLAIDPSFGGNLLEMQNHALSLLEYFLCNRHRGVLGVNANSGIDNEDDLTLIKEVETYISENYCQDTFTVDSILKKTYTSYHRLNFLFKSIHGMTISEYIRNKRIEKSKEMIAANAKSISQIAYEIGYSSISNYILAFKKIYRITPGKYKKQMEA